VVTEVLRGRNYYVSWPEPSGKKKAQTKNSRKKGEPNFTVVGQTTVKKEAAYLIFGNTFELPIPSVYGFPCHNILNPEIGQGIS